MARNVFIDFVARTVGFDDIAKKGAKAAKDTEKAFGESTKKIGNQFSDLQSKVAALFGAFAAGAVAGKAIKASNDLEKALIGLGAAAKQAGLNAQSLEKDVVGLAKDGTISVNQLTASYKILLNQGLSPEFIKRLLDSGKAVSALNNITGDAGQALADFVKGVATGSADLVENFNPSIRQTINQLGGFEKISKSAEAKQKLYNAVIEQGTALQDDYNKILTSGAGAFDRSSKAVDGFFVALGDGLKVALVPVLNVLTPLIEGFTSFFKTLSPLSQALIVLVPLVAALAPGVVALAGAFKALLISLGPIALALTAVVAVTVAIIESQQKAAKAADLERLALLKNKDATKLTKDEKAELLKLNNKYADEAKFLKALQNENVAISEQIRLTRRLAGLKEITASDRRGEIAQSNKDIQRLFQNVQGPAADKFRKIQEDFNKATAATANIKDPTKREIEQAKILQKFGQNLSSLASDQDVANALGTRRNFLRARAESLRTDAEDLLSITIRDAQASEADRPRTPGATPPGGGGGGASRKGDILPFLQFIDARREAFNEQLRREVEAEKENAKLISKNKEEELERFAKIDEAATRKRLQFELDLAAQTAQRAGTIAQGATQAFTANNLSGQLQGAATAAGAVNPAVGGIIGGIAGVVGAFEVLSGKAQREARERELNNRQLEAERQLREAINKNLLQEQQALDEATRIQLRVNDLTLGKDGAQSANRAVLEATAARQAAEAGLSGTSATEVGAELQDLITRGPDTEILAQTIRSAAQVAAGGRREDISKAISLLDRALSTGSNADPALIQTATNYRSQLREFLNLRNRAANESDVSVAQSLILSESEARKAAGQAALAATQGIISGNASTLDRSQALLSTLEALQQLSGGGGAGGNISLQSARAQSFIDIGRGGVADSFGIFRAPTIRPNLLGLPTGGVSQAIASLDKQESFQERSTKSLEQLVDIAKSQLAELRAISAAAGVNNTNEQRIFSTLESIERRII